MESPVTETIILEITNQYDRIRTRCHDQDHIREIFESEMASSAQMASLYFYTDLMMDMIIIMMEQLNNNGITLDAKQQANYDKIKFFASQYNGLNLENNTWQVDWLYLMKRQLLDIQNKFLSKRLELGFPPLP